MSKIKFKDFEKRFKKSYRNAMIIDILSLVLSVSYLGFTIYIIVHFVTKFW